MAPRLCGAARQGRRDPNLRSPSPAGKGEAPLSPALAERLLLEQARRDAPAPVPGRPPQSPPSHSFRLLSLGHGCRSKAAAPASSHSVCSPFPAPTSR